MSVIVPVPHTIFCFRPSWRWLHERKALVCTCCRRGYSPELLLIIAMHFRMASSSNTYHPNSRA